MASRLIRNQLPERVAGSTPVSSASSQAISYAFNRVKWLFSFSAIFALTPEGMEMTAKKSRSL